MVINLTDESTQTQTTIESFSILLSSLHRSCCYYYYSRWVCVVFSPIFFCRNGVCYLHFYSDGGKTFLHFFIGEGGRGGSTINESFFNPQPKKMSQTINTDELFIVFEGAFGYFFYCLSTCRDVHGCVKCSDGLPSFDSGLRQMAPPEKSPSQPSKIS